MSDDVTLSPQVRAFYRAHLDHTNGHGVTLHRDGETIVAGTCVCGSRLVFREDQRCALPSPPEIPSLLLPVPPDAKTVATLLLPDVAVVIVGTFDAQTDESRVTIWRPPS